ncbi:MAG: TetR/AcrR family transcriptional regulator [Pseudomonadota bacterium]|nr:TetR/AcrR family transcriptional regulator [Pseudomonadota bacterium]
MSSKGQQTQERILSATLDLIERQGFHSTGLQQIIKTSGAPKGSLYFHFPEGKDQIVACALQQGAEFINTLIQHAFAMAQNPAQGVGWLFDGLTRRLLDSHYEKGCPVATTALETGDAHPQVRQACEQAYDLWQSSIIQGLQQQGMDREQANREAPLILSILEGALMLAKVRRSRLPLDQARDAVLMRLT